MKKTLLAMIISITSFGFADEGVSLPVTKVSSEFENQAKDVILKDARSERLANKLFYIKLGAFDATPKDVFPGGGLGLRARDGKGAIDISFNYSKQGELGDTKFYALPRISYLRYLNPEKGKSFFYGAGVGWGGITRPEEEKFVGLLANAVVGFEWALEENWGSFFEITASQGALSVKKMESFNDLPMPIVEMAFGIGF